MAFEELKRRKKQEIEEGLTQLSEGILTDAQKKALAGNLQLAITMDEAALADGITEGMALETASRMGEAMGWSVQEVTEKRGQYQGIFENILRDHFTEDGKLTPEGVMEYSKTLATIAEEVRSVDGNAALSADEAARLDAMMSNQTSAFIGMFDNYRGGDAAGAIRAISIDPTVQAKTVEPYDTIFQIAAAEAAPTAPSSNTQVSTSSPSPSTESFDFMALIQNNKILTSMAQNMGADSVTGMTVQPGNEPLLTFINERFSDMPQKDIKELLESKHETKSLIREFIEDNPGFAYDRLDEALKAYKGRDKVTDAAKDNIDAFMKDLGEPANQASMTWFISENAGLLTNILTAEAKPGQTLKANPALDSMMEFYAADSERFLQLAGQPGSAAALGFETTKRKMKEQMDAKLGEGNFISQTVLSVIDQYSAENIGYFSHSMDAVFGRIFGGLHGQILLGKTDNFSLTGNGGLLESLQSGLDGWGQLFSGGLGHLQASMSVAGAAAWQNGGLDDTFQEVYILDKDANPITLETHGEAAVEAAKVAQKEAIEGLKMKPQELEPPIDIG